MFNWLRERKINKRLTAIRESAFPVYEEKCHKWISSYFDVRRNINYLTGRVFADSFAVIPFLCGNPNLRHGDLIQKYVNADLLLDYGNNFKRSFTMMWREFKHFETDAYCQFKKIFNVIQIWDATLDDKINVACLDAGIPIRTSTWCVSPDDSLFLNVTPKIAEQILEIVSEKAPQDTDIGREIVKRYEDYVISELAKGCDLSTLSASQPKISLETFSNRSAKILRQIQDEEDTAKLKIIPSIREKLAPKKKKKEQKEY